MEKTDGMVAGSQTRWLIWMEYLRILLMEETDGMVEGSQTHWLIS